MPINYVIKKEARLVLTTGTGVVTFPESRAHQDRLLLDPEFDPEFNQLIDMTAVTRFEVSADQAREIAQRPLFSTNSKRAVVAADPAIYGMHRVIEVRHHFTPTHSEMRVFCALPAALQWLGLEELPE